jgi:hypothetical protein
VNGTTILLTASILCGGLLMATILGFDDSAGAQVRSQKAQGRQSAFACKLLALTPEQRKRHFEELGPKLLSLKKRVRELPNGYEFEFPQDVNTVQLVAEWAIGEHACCPFFEIDMRLEREGGSFWLRLTGREGVKQFIQSEGAAWIRP